jgi:hypothetical protein
MLSGYGLINMFKISKVYATKKLSKPLQPKEILNMSHTTTLFSQTLSLIPRHVFQKLEARHKVGRSSRKFGFKEQFTAMAFIQLAARRSMRDGLRVLNAARKKLYHFGFSPVARSTFADANNSRPVGFFKDRFAEIYGLCAAKAPKHKFRFKRKLYSLDATTISLCLSLFPWAKFRQNKGGVKINTLLDHDGHIPAFVTIGYLLLAYQKFLSKTKLSVQLLFQLISCNLFGSESLEELLNPRRRKNENPCYLSLLDMAA